ncbi:MAG TPA: ATP-binding protein [Bryobacteraceae bacterium]|nr:ATP-binding protein [Bryobacteraceae bacterium]
MRHWSIGARLTLWYSLVLFAGLALFAAGIWLVVAHGLNTAVDESLAAEMQGVATVLQTEYNPARPDHIREELAEYAEATPEGRFIEVRDAQGELLLPAGASSRGPHYRTLARTVTTGGRKYHIVVAAPLESTELTLRRLSEVLLWAMPLVLLIGSLGGYWMSRRALQPVDAITRSAQTIGIENLSDRLQVPAARDELARLAETWNGMLGRLEAAVKRLSAFTADASHELRTPIALIRATAELTLRRDRPVETYREALRHIIDESDRTARLIEDLLVLARADAGLPMLPLDRLELAPLVRDVCEQGQILAEERQLEFSSDVPDQPVYVDANDPALRRLLMLLVDNAVKYTPAGGRIKVSVALDSSGPTVTVSDTGIGIPDAALPHVFERFYRVDESRNREAGGAGLGLSIAQWIADRHHARLEAESVLGSGSAFRVRFPGPPASV